MARRLQALEDTASCSDATLVRAAAANDEAALAELYRRHAPAAERVARSVATNSEDAADAVAEAFTRVFTALTSGRVGTLDFRSYVVAATRNVAIDNLRRSDRVGPSGDLVPSSAPNRGAVRPSRSSPARSRP
jgi:DNA-directed RNA polymerase specialized sigma24 family protein